MTIQLTSDAMKKIFPRAPQAVLDAFVAKQSVLDKVGVTHTRTRLAYFFANVEHECGGFTIPNLTENINYTAERMAKVWPNRFPSAAAVQAKYGFAPGWQKKAFDDIYGNRMGNRPHTSDGSTYIGRGGPQWTGLDGYRECEKRTGLPAVAEPASVTRLGMQPEVCAAFWDWKQLNAKADLGDFQGAVRLWNGGTNGLADRLNLMAGNDPAIARLENVNRVLPVAKAMPGGPPTPTPPKALVDAATKKERATLKAGATGAAAGGAGEVAKAGTEHPPALLAPVVTYSLIGVGIAVAVVATVLIMRKQSALARNWF